MTLSKRIFLAYALFVCVCAYFIAHIVTEEIRPGVRQSTEETLVDTANLLAEFLAQPLKDGSIASEQYRAIFDHYGERELNASIWGFDKKAINHRIYVTDQKGIVVLDSYNMALGQDYSRWNDVHLTLQGKYGARSSQETIGDETSTVMYVAAPIKDGDTIIGVVSVAKPNSSVQPFITRIKNRLTLFASIIVILGLAIGAAFSLWLSAALGRLRQYAVAVSQGERATLPVNALRSHELQQLAQALESMRTELDGKAHVEHYVQSFAHEFKSPLAGIRASAELLQNPISPEHQKTFVANIDHESARLEQLIDRLLRLAALEQQQTPNSIVPFNLSEHVRDVLDAFKARIELKAIEIQVAVDAKAKIKGEAFLIHQAIVNLLDNAVAFTPKGGVIHISASRQSDTVAITVNNTGTPIPEFALTRLTERFYSLPRPESGKKSTGLGLCLVKEVAQLHHGRFEIGNTPAGVQATLWLPYAH